VVRTHEIGHVARRVAAVDVLLDRELGAQKEALVAQIPHDPGAIARFRDVDRHWKEVKARLSAQRAEE